MQVLKAERSKLYQEAAKQFTINANLLLREKESISVGLCGGRSVANFYPELATQKKIDWDKVHLFQTDERISPIGIESNSVVIEANLISKLGEQGSIEDPWLFNN